MSAEPAPPSGDWLDLLVIRVDDPDTCLAPPLTDTVAAHPSGFRLRDVTGLHEDIDRGQADDATDTVRDLHRRAFAVALVLSPAPAKNASNRQASLRARLQDWGVPHAVLHVHGAPVPEIVRRWAMSLVPCAGSVPRPDALPRWRHLCGRCGEPTCERAMFRRLTSP